MAAKAFMDVVAIFVLVFAIMSPYVETQPEAPPPSLSDEISIDQGIAYALMLVALVLTYLIHPLDSSSYSFFG